MSTTWSDDRTHHDSQSPDIGPNVQYIGRRSRKISSPLQSAYYVEGDVTLISSNNFAFMTHSYHLISTRQVHVHIYRFLSSLTSSNSTVFRDMLETMQPQSNLTIHLTNDEIETPMSVQLFLDIIDGKLLPNLDIQDLRAPILLAQKYDCPAVLNTLHLLLEKHARSFFNVKPDVFVMAAIYGQPQFCAEVIRDDGDESYVNQG